MDLYCVCGTRFVNGSSCCWYWTTTSIQYQNQSFLLKFLLCIICFKRRTFGICDLERCMCKNYANCSRHTITFIWNCLCRNKEYDANFMCKFVHITNLFTLNAYLSNCLKWSRCTSQWQRQFNFKLDEMFIMHIYAFALPLWVL